ncbi:hypothetical protein ACLEEJ_00125 [Lonsdalea quercina]|uniref:hypothetical protein n=1 Tax=Lonsdalea quercina TaxID=71657 RepID=UPI00397709B1
MSSGTIALTNNSTTVTGTSTSFSSDLTPGDYIVAVVGGVTYTLPVKTVDSGTQVTLIKAYDGPTTSGAAWSAVPKDTMTAITAQLASQVTYAIRGLNLDKTNWQQILTGTGNVTVSLPDGSQYSGPAWRGLADQVSANASAIAAVNNAKMATGNNLSDVASVSSARKNLKLDYSRSFVNTGTGVTRLFATEDSGLMIITRRFPVSAAANSSTGWTYNWVNDGASNFNGYPGLSVTGEGGNSSSWRIGVEVSNDRAVGGFVHNSSSSAVDLWITVTAIGMKA